MVRSEMRQKVRNEIRDDRSSDQKTPNVQLVSWCVSVGGTIQPISPNEHQPTKS